MDQIENSTQLDHSLILLMPTKHMGNLLVALRAIETLVLANRGCTWVVVDESYRDIIDSAPAIGKPIYYPRARLRKAGLWDKIGLLLNFYRQLRAPEAKLLLNFDAQPISTTLALLAGVKQRWGLSDTPRHSAYQKIVDQHPHHPHRFYHYHQFAQVLAGDTSAAAYPTLQAQTQHQASLRQLLDTLKVDGNRPFACIHAGATKTYKQWPPERFAGITDWLAEQGVQVILIGAGDSDKTIIEQVVHTSRSQPINLCNRLNLGELIALFKQCCLFLGNDSGPMHLAAASQTPVFALFGPTDELRWGPLGANATLIRNPTPCTETCSKKFCPENFRCIKTLPAQEVRAVLQQHLSGSRLSEALIQV